MMDTIDTIDIRVGGIESFDIMLLVKYVILH